jgi:hypothetical protein
MRVKSLPGIKKAIRELRMTSLMAVSANVNSAHISLDPGGLALGLPPR